MGIAGATKPLASGCAAALFALFALFTLPALAQDISCRVIGVSDGDTLTCLTAAKEQVKVRLAEIDAPEKAQAFGERSRQSLADLCFQKPAELRATTRDRYGRTVARVTCGGIDANAEQVRHGMAWVYEQYAKDRALYRLQDEARAEQRGLWADPRPVKPWEWRRGNTAGAGAPATAVEQRMVKPAVSGQFSCGAKRTCKEMTSCAEARHYLTQCGLTRLDGDGDGVPCEALCR